MTIHKRSRATNFSEDLRRELEKRLGSLKWVKNWKPEIVKNESADVAGLRDKKAVVIIEVELRRANPVSNVAKIWKWVDEGYVSGKIVFFHALSEVFESRPHQVENALLIGKKLQRYSHNVKYMNIDLDYRPYKGAKAGGGRRRKAAKTLAADIVRRMNRMG